MHGVMHVYMYLFRGEFSCGCSCGLLCRQIVWDEEKKKWIDVDADDEVRQRCTTFCKP